ncbi:MAG: SDR family oxidoreductase [Acidimicrobiia bacterium]|nr:SDR family oxidoreductase [Acidimicrobiia bacterium]
MADRLDGRVAVITGGGNGIGRATAVRFAEEGAAVLVADIQPEQAAETVSMVEAAGGRAASVIVDAASPDDNDAMAQAAVDQLGGLDVLVTAAGVSHADYSSGDLEADLKMAAGAMEFAEDPARAFPAADLDGWRRVLDVNLTGTLLAMQACTARMLDAGTSGAVVTIASVAAKHPDAGPLAYTVSKAGVWMLTKKAARMLASAGIRVNAIGPGFIDTNMTAFIDVMAEQLGENPLANMIPLGHKGEPVDIANCALFLASDEARYFTGEILHPDGGFYTE